MLTKKEIESFLEENGIRHDDKITVHASLRSAGPIEDGADGLIDALRDYLNEGILLIPTHTWDKVSKEHPYFDVRTYVPCIGTLARVAAFRPDGVRSLHPTHSVAAFGKDAADYVRGEEKNASPAPLGSCLSRLYEENGKVLLLGVGHNRNTYLHAVDERLALTDRLNPEGYVITIRDYDGNEIQTPPYHGHYCSLTNDVSQFYPNYKEALEYTGAVTYGKLGNALVYVCDVRKMTDTVMMLWEKADHDLCVKSEPVPASYYMDAAASARPGMEGK